MADTTWTAGCSCGWRGASEDAETHPCAWDEVDEVREHVNWDLRMAEEATETVRNPEVVQGPARPAEEVIKAVHAARTYLDRAERDAVRELRLRRFSWSEIGDIFGITRQAAQQRFGKASAVAKSHPAHTENCTDCGCDETCTAPLPPCPNDGLAQRGYQCSTDHATNLEHAARNDQ
jgi:hypothetical protein